MENYLKTQIQEAIKTAMREKDTVTKDTLKVLMGEIQRNEQNDKGKVDLTNEDIVGIVKKMVTSIKQTDANSPELAVLEKYLPSQLTREKIVEIASAVKVDKALSTSREMGVIMAHFKANYSGQYDGKVVSEVAKEILA